MVLYAPDRIPVRAVLASVALFGSIMLATPSHVLSQAVHSRVDVAQVAKGYRVSKMVNTTITNDKEREDRLAR